jgi:alpha-ribazole phosphatase
MSDQTTKTGWWWIRHAPVHGHGGRIYGQNDHPADTSDRAAFQTLARRLPENAVWVRSHLSRTLQTAQALIDEGIAAPELLIEPGIAEQHLGVWEGMTQAELTAAKDGAFHRYWLAPADHRPEGGESFEDVVKRVGEVMERLTTAYAGRDIVAIAHGGSIRAALGYVLDLHPEAALSMGVGHISLTRFERVDGPGEGHDWRVLFVNLPPE